MSLVSDAAYKYYLNINPSETITNNLTPLISSAEKKVKEYLNRDIEATTYTSEIYNGSGCNELMLRQTPVTAVTTIEYYEGYDSGEDWYALTLGTDYERKIIPTQANSVILDGYEFVEGVQNYRVTYTAGYSTVPADIQQACKELVALYWNASPMKNNWIGLQTANNNAGSATQNLTIDTEAEQKILNKIAHHRAVNV